jgi:polysaccharide export outer membrane protein
MSTSASTSTSVSKSMSMLTLVLVLWSAGWGISGCATTHPPYDYASEPDPRKHDFVLGPSDVLRVSVWRNPDLSADPVVRPDGTITLPLVGDLRAAGMTPTQVRQEIERRLKAYVKDEAAIVTVAVTAINSYRFVISGNVEKPGAYSANHYVTVSEAITLAGGPTRLATPENTLILRSNNPGEPPRRIPVDYPQVLNGKRSQEDLVLLAGDTVYVP